MSRREVVGKEVSIHASPVHVQANESPVQLQANGSPVQVQAMQNWQNCEHTSETNGKEKAKTSERNVKKGQKHLKNAKENAEIGQIYESSISSCVKTNSKDVFFDISHGMFGSFHHNN